MNTFDKLKNTLIIVLAGILLFIVPFSVVILLNLFEEQQQTKDLKERIEIINKNHNLDVLRLNKELGISNSKLVTQTELAEKYKKQLTDKDTEFEKTRDKYKLDIKSRDDLIAKLRGQSEGGTTVVIGECPKNDDKKPMIAYFWNDKLKRFVLEDPDIFTSNNEKFTYSQMFKVVGEVFTDKSGNVQIRRVELQEMWDSSDEEGLQLEEVPGSTISLVDSNFEYVNEKVHDSKTFADIFTFRPLATIDTALMPGLGFEFFNLGKLFDYVNLGFYTKLAADLSEPLNGSLENSRIALGLNYHLLPKLVKTNFAIGTSLDFPFNNLQEPVITVDAIFYLTEDLNPFIEAK